MFKATEMKMCVSRLMMPAVVYGVIPLVYSMELQFLAIASPGDIVTTPKQS